MRAVLLANRIATFLWGFAAVWTAMLVVFTWVLLRDGPPEGHSFVFLWSLLAAFWLGAVAMIRYALAKPCCFVALEPGGSVSLTWRYPHKRVRKSFPAIRLTPPVVIEGKDSDGDPYFRARLTLPDGSGFDLAEGHDRTACEAACQRFLQAVDRQSTPSRNYDP